MRPQYTKERSRPGSNDSRFGYRDDDRRLRDEDRERDPRGAYGDERDWSARDERDERGDYGVRSGSSRGMNEWRDRDARSSQSSEWDQDGGGWARTGPGGRSGTSWDSDVASGRDERDWRSRPSSGRQDWRTGGMSSAQWERDGDWRQQPRDDRDPSSGQWRQHGSWEGAWQQRGREQGRGYVPERPSQSYERGFRGPADAYGGGFEPSFGSGFAGSYVGSQSNPYGLTRSGSASSPSSARRGPKGWQRSDERLKEEICERLTASHQIDCSEVTVQVQGGKVSLEGTVPDRWMKHSIEDLVDNSHGVKDIDNRLRVSRHENAGDDASGAGAKKPNSGNQGANSGTQSGHANR
jgi:hypothetical protein